MNILGRYFCICFASFLFSQSVHAMCSAIVLSNPHVAEQYWDSLSLDEKARVMANYENHETDIALDEAKTKPRPHYYVSWEQKILLAQTAWARPGRYRLGSVERNFIDRILGKFQPYVRKEFDEIVETEDVENYKQSGSDKYFVKLIYLVGTGRIIFAEVIALRPLRELESGEPNLAWAAEIYLNDRALSAPTASWRMNSPWVDVVDLARWQDFFN